MEVTINQVILHLLDPGASEPMLSDRPHGDGCRPI